MNLHEFFKFSTLGSIRQCRNTLRAMNLHYSEAATQSCSLEKVF